MVTTTATFSYHRKYTLSSPRQHFLIWLIVRKWFHGFHQIVRRKYKETCITLVVRLTNSSSATLPQSSFWVDESLVDLIHNFFPKMPFLISLEEYFTFSDWGVFLTLNSSVETLRGHYLSTVYAKTLLSTLSHYDWKPDLGDEISYWHKASPLTECPVSHPEPGGETPFPEQPSALLLPTNCFTHRRRWLHLQVGWVTAA